MDSPKNHIGRPFLLMEGGPLYRIEKRVGTIKANAPLTMKRAVWAALLTWFPLLILSAFQGTAIGRAVPVSFLKDFSTYSRFLLATPLLLMAEMVLGPRIAEAAEHFITSGVVPEEDYQKFDQAVAHGLQYRDSVVAEIIVAILAYTIAITAFRSNPVHVSTWYATRTAEGRSITFAGWWLILFCVPLFHFLYLRWLWRLFLWFQFLARVRTFDLRLFPTHPDEAGGIGFVGDAQRFFGILLFAYSCGIAGVLANDIVYGDTTLKSFVPAIVAYVVFALLLIVGPLSVFTGKLLATKRAGLLKYGTLATAYTGSFDRKWIEGKNPESEPLLGTGDIQSLADLGNSYAFVVKMNALPVNPRLLIQLVLASLFPLTPLLLTVMPLPQLIKLLLKVLM